MVDVQQPIVVPAPLNLIGEPPGELPLDGNPWLIGAQHLFPICDVQQPTVVPAPQNLIGEQPGELPLDGNPWLIRAQRWERAERAAEQIIAEFRPTAVTERKKVEVINYLQELLKLNLDCEVFAYGSVPLRTFLPDGDVDLTVVGAWNDDFVIKIATLLEIEATKSSVEFVVKDVRVINSKVKLVKCIVQNLRVDISINQIGGLCSLCFLEQVDQVIGKNHLLKESIILIKAWCYCESRTLGAQAGLLSTYGLEILVLYIVNVFHRTLDGPLSVLYKFLEYFGMFDWDNYCISLKGPVRISASPEIAAEKSPNSHDLLLGDDFLGYCLKMLSVPMRGGNGFPLKHLNIIDPLKDNNNVGCSINKANSIRIRSAFSYGARKLGQVLVAQEDTIADELHKFFSNTTILLAGEQRRDIQDPESLSTGSGAQTRSSTGNGLSGNEYSKEGEDVSNLRVHDLKISEASVNASASGFLDLSGDLSYHLACLGHARRWCAYAKAPPGLPPPFPHLINMRAMKHAHRVADFKSDRFHHGGMNGGIVLCPEFHPLNQLLMPRPPFLEGPGSMTYLPEMVLPVDRASNGPVTSPRGLHFLVGHGNGAKVLDAPHKGLNPNANMSIPQPEPVDQLVPVRPSMPFGEALLPAQLMHRPKPCFRKHRFRVQPRNHLIEEDDSRPLSV